MFATVRAASSRAIAKGAAGTCRSDREPIEAERERQVRGEGDPDKVEGEQKAPARRAD